MMYEHDVIVAGAGPVGLFLACELRRAKLSVLVLERATDPASPLKRLPFGMRGLWGPSVEAFYRRGLLQLIEAAPRGEHPSQATPQPIAPGSPRRGAGGHFAGLQFDLANVDSARWSYRLAGPGDAQTGTEIEHLERELARQADSMGVRIERGQAVEGLEMSLEDVTVRSADRQYRSRWLVGCDGGRSTVRKLAGFDFVGTEPAFTGYSVQVDLADPSLLPLGRHHRFFPMQKGIGGLYTQWQPGSLAIADFDGGAFHGTQPLTREHVQSVLRRVSGTDVAVTALHFGSTWTDRARQATTYRQGRVLLAGDAAHIHSPLGGQGLNLGFGDAMNLGWKLAATIRDEAPSGLLDSYTTERHPIGARILDWSRAQVELLQSPALMQVVRDLIDTHDGATYFAQRQWGATLRYDLGDEHPLVGRSCPDFQFANGARVGELLREGRGLLLDFGGALSALDGRWGDRVRYQSGKAMDDLGVSALLVRPDGVVAWASDTPANSAAVLQAAAPWFKACAATTGTPEAQLTCHAD
jgi:2-polyprenyl-6-methoxyphenol hydroxylase-like FAD-dependent oxidoreductase